MIALQALSFFAGIVRNGRIVDTVSQQQASVSIFVIHDGVGQDSRSVCLFVDRSNKNALSLNVGKFLSFAACRIAGDGINPDRCVWLDASDDGVISQILAIDGWNWTRPAEQVTWQTFVYDESPTYRRLMEALLLRFGGPIGDAGNMLLAFLAQSKAKGCTPCQRSAPLIISRTVAAAHAPIHFRRSYVC